jgi:DNA-binding transcriptional ArsR family regulator
VQRRIASRSLERAAPLFAALGDESRLWLLSRLSSDGPSSIARLSDGARITRQAVTKHLHVLSDAGLVRGSREGRESLWELETKRLEDARGALLEIERQWEAALRRLKVFVED